MRVLIAPSYNGLVYLPLCVTLARALKNGSKSALGVSDIWKEMPF